MLAEAAQTVDHVVIIHRGRLVATGRLEELTERGGTLEDVFLQLTGAAS
jgi:ABC-2 type transport system ATP-binding protein